MSTLSVGLVGLPNVGKSTLFQALTALPVPAENYPFCTIKPHCGQTPIPDRRLEVLARLSKSPKVIPSILEVWDIAGLVEGASQGEGLGNDFLSNIRDVDAILHVVRCFDNSDIIHEMGTVDPVRDCTIIGLELILADLQSAQESLARLVKKRANDSMTVRTVAALQQAIHILNEEQPLRTYAWSEEEQQALAPYRFLTLKPLFYAANVDEANLAGNAHVTNLQQAVGTQEQVLTFSADLEAQLRQLSPQEADEMRASYGMAASSLDAILRHAFTKLNLICYLTTGEKETRSWTIPKGTLAPQAAGKIHTDLEKGFIRAETISYDDFVHYQSRSAAKAAGKARMEGKEYVVQDGDVILFHNT